MERVVRVFDRHSDAEAADRAYYASLPPQERLNLLQTFMERYRAGLGEAARGSREFIGLLLSQDVEFLVVGGHAVAFHGYPRLTEDIDLLVRPSLENGSRILQASRSSASEASASPRKTSRHRIA